MWFQNKHLSLYWIESQVSKSVFELNLVLGLWFLLNMVIDLLQEAPRLLAELLKAGTDSRVNN